MGLLKIAKYVGFLVKLWILLQSICKLAASHLIKSIDNRIKVNKDY